MGHHGSDHPLDPLQGARQRLGTTAHPPYYPYRHPYGLPRALSPGHGPLRLSHAGQWHELGRLPVAQRDGAGLVQQQRIHVARGFHSPARHRQHVEAHQTVHAGDADGRQQRADGGRD